VADVDLSKSDRAVLADPRVQDLLRASTREMFAQGVWGWVDDDLAVVTPWGFDVAELRVPVEIRYGATDVLVPPSHGEWLAAHVPNATVIVDETGGHLSSPDAHLERLRALVVA
jgi:pimeloyl-ACP methyl ester carboxylesterase